MKVIELATPLLHVFEGLRLKAYRDSGGVLTVGFGHTGPVDGQPLTEATTITIEKAYELFEADAAPLLKIVDGLPLTAAAAYVSFGYNCGAGALRRVLAGQAKHGDFIHDRRGNVSPGLVSRRALEAALIQAGSNS